MKNCALVLVLALLASCSSPIRRTDMWSELRDARADVGGAAWSDKPIQEIANLRPQLQAPFRLAIAPPIGSVRRSTGFASHTEESLVWREEEKELLREWGARLEEEGWISELVFLPSFFLDPNLDDGDATVLVQLRKAAARHRADAVLVVSSVSERGNWMNAAALFDLTILGMALVEGHETEAVTVMEGALFDTRNEYLYVSASSHGEVQQSATLFQVDSVPVVEESRYAALEGLVQELLEGSGVRSGK